MFSQATIYNTAEDRARRPAVSTVLLGPDLSCLASVEPCGRLISTWLRAERNSPALGYARCNESRGNIGCLGNCSSTFGFESQDSLLHIRPVQTSVPFVTGLIVASSGVVCDLIWVD